MVIKLFFISFLGAGVYAVIDSIRRFLYLRRLWQNGILVDGRVTEVDIRGNGKSRLYRTYFSFRAQNGRVVGTKERFWSKRKYQVGQDISVLYDLDNPYNAILKPDWRTWMWIALPGVIEIAFATVDLGILLGWPIFPLAR